MESLLWLHSMSQFSISIVGTNTYLIIFSPYPVNHQVCPVLSLNIYLLHLYCCCLHSGLCLSLGLLLQFSNNFLLWSSSLPTHPPQRRESNFDDRNVETYKKVERIVWWILLDLSPSLNTWLILSHLYSHSLFLLDYFEEDTKHFITLSLSQFSSVTQSCLTLCDTMDCSTSGFPVPEPT